MSKFILSTDKEILETIAATFPTQKELIAATSVYYNTTSPLGDVEKEKEVCYFALVVTSKDTNYHLTKEDMDQLAALYVDNKELLSVLDKAQKTKTVPVGKATKAKNGDGCAYLARDPN